MYDIERMPAQIDIGFTGEKGFRTIEINMAKWMAILPDGVPSIVHIRPGETRADAYIAATTFEDNILRWTITAGDLGSSEGMGLMQVWLEEEENDSVEKRGKCTLVTTRINGALNDASEVVPAAQTAWLEQMTALKVATVDAKTAAVDANTAAQAAKTAAETSEGNAEAWAVGQRDGTDVQSTDPAYHNNSKYYATQASDSAADAAAAEAAAEAAALHYPYVDVVTGNWMLWDPETSAWVNTGIHAKGDTGAVPNIQVGTVTTVLPDQPAAVTRRSGSPDTAPIFDFNIPKGETGSVGAITGADIPVAPSDPTKINAALSDKATKVTGGTTGNVVTLDANGDIQDSGHPLSDYVPTANIYNGTDKNTSGYVLDARVGPTLVTSDSNIRKGTGFQAKLSSGDWILNSGENAVAGDYIWKNGVLGVATASITGGSTAIVEGTNWTKCAAKGALSEIATNVGVLSNAGVTYSFTIASTDWSAGSPYVYTWTNASVTAGCRVEAIIATGAPTEVPYLSYEKVSGGVKFTAPLKPTQGIPVVVNIINAQSTAITTVTGSMVSTSAISGASNVDEAFTALNAIFSTIEDKQITRVSGTSYFTERSAFKARREGNTIGIYSYVNITTEVPVTTNFANTGFSAAEGNFLFIMEDGSNPTPVQCSNGLLNPKKALATGYYYAIGMALMPL